MKKTKRKFNFTNAFESKSFRIAFSIVIAILLWTYVVYSENPDIPVFVRNIPVEFTGVESLTDSKLIITDIDEEKVTLEITGKRNKVTKLTNSNMTVVVDLTDIIRDGSSAGQYHLDYDISYPNDVNPNDLTVTDASVDFITAKVEKLVEKTVEVIGINDCNTAKGYQSEPMIFEPETITVSGPESIVNRVASANVTLKRNNVSKTIQENVDVVLVDENSIMIAMDNLILSQPTVFVTLPVVMVKEVPLNVNFVFGNSATNSNVSHQIDPPVVSISGDPEVLSDINSINLGTIDLKSFSTSTSETFPITLPNNVDNLSGANTATVAVEVLNQSTARISANNIQYRNATLGYRVTVITQSLDILLRGSEDSLKNITSDNIRIIADLAELGTATGNMSVSAQVYIDGYTDVDAIGEYKISVSVTDR